MALNQTASRWNQAIALENPMASAVASVLGTAPQRVFEDVPEFLYFDHNLLLRLPPTAHYGGGVPALSISLILRKNFFASDALIRTADLAPFSLLGMTVPCSAQAMLDQLRKTDAKHVATATESDRWTVHYGKGLSLLFLPLANTAGDAQQSELAMIEFFYSLPFEGQCSARVEAVPAPST